MKLKIVISSAVKLEEKKCVKDKLIELQRLNIIKIDWIYDCAEHATVWGTITKQEEINDIILSADWFICLIPQHTVGYNTWKELELVLEAQNRGLQIIISVFHPINIPVEKKNEPIPENHVTFDYIQQQAKQIQNNKEEHYCISYEYNKIDDLLKELHEEFIRLYYTDKLFRAKFLAKISRFGRDVEAKELYFDENRASVINGFLGNKYCQRRSVDGMLQEAMAEQRKFIVLQGAPGAGKTRAIYQLLADPQQLTQISSTKNEQYALGFLADKNIIVLNQDNIKEVYHFLEGEKDHYNKKNTLNEFFILCDQIKDVFGMLSNNELFDFFDIVTNFNHIYIIATTIPSAFNNFRERWRDYGRKPFDDDQLTKVITIPPISSDDEERDIRDWLWNELEGNSNAETIGDYIPQLNNYKQNIVKKIYDETERHPYLPELLTAFKTTESYRHDTALFIPILIAKTNIFSRNRQADLERFLGEMVSTINFLINNNVIWVRKSVEKDGEAPENIKKMYRKNFELEYGMDSYENFLFDGEEYKDTPLSTAYSYGINEIIWNELEREDFSRHIKGEGTVLKNIQECQDVVRAAKEFHRAFPDIRSLRRILPRIPRTNCYEEASKELWNYVYKECEKYDPKDGEVEEFLTTVGMLIGRAKELSQIKEAINIITNKNLSPDYNTIGELYSTKIQLNKGVRTEITNYISELQECYQLRYENFFSLSRRITFYDMTFDEAIKEVTESKYVLNGCEKAMTLQEAVAATTTKIELFNLERLFALLARKGETVEQWKRLFELHKSLHINIRRSAIYQYFSVIVDQFKSHVTNEEETERKMLTELQELIEQFGNVIANEDKESCYFYSIEASWNFKQALPIYQYYLECFDTDNQRLISIALRTVCNNEFQTALNFLIETDERLKAKKQKLSDICYNNLIKSAPNMGEALGVVPYITHLQDHTLTSILTILKNRKIEDKQSNSGFKTDPKIFYYAYSAIMRDVFFELRRSPHVIGILYDLSTTHKHERFIRNTFLSHIEESERYELIDYSTTISSIRMRKKYRSLEETWQIFNICRNYFHNNKRYVDSELYNSMMSKLIELGEKGIEQEEILLDAIDRLRNIINEDYNRIIRDEHFVPSLYRLFPEKRIVDDAGNINKEFINDINSTYFTKNQALNNILKELKKEEYGFDIMWKFYEYMIEYYHKNGKRKTLRPDIRTVTLLMEAVQTAEQLEKAEDAAKIWGFESALLSNKLLRDAHEKARKEVSCNPIEEKKMTPPNRKPIKQEDKNNYKDRTDNVIELAKKDIYTYGCLTSVQTNKYLDDIHNIIKDINKSKFLRPDIAKKCKVGVYMNILNNLIDKYYNKLSFDAISYTYLVKISPKWDVKRWIKEFQKHEEEYKHDFVFCSAISCSFDVCNEDIDIGLSYFDFWQDIVHNIGYDPTDPTSVSEFTEVSQFNNVEDFDGYWLTRSNHSILEMRHFWRNRHDKTALRFIKEEMEHFEQHGVQFPQLLIDKESIDFKDIIEEYADLIN